MGYCAALAPQHRPGWGDPTQGQLPLLSPLIQQALAQLRANTRSKQPGSCWSRSSLPGALLQGAGSLCWGQGGLTSHDWMQWMTEGSGYHRSLPVHTMFWERRRGQRSGEVEEAGKQPAVLSGARGSPTTLHCSLWGRTAVTPPRTLSAPFEACQTQGSC